MTQAFDAIIIIGARTGGTIPSRDNSGVHAR
jgi:hypothetical protein